MAESSNITLKSKEPSLGQIQIAPEVLEIIVGIAVSQIDGVNRMRGSISSSVNELFGRKKSLGKGVKLTIVDDQISVDVYAYLNYGVSVPKVALAIQDKVKQQILFMTDLALNEVNVHITGIVTEKTESTIDPNNLFGDEDPEVDENEDGEES
ncbi:alkaline shock protein [Lactobacillus plantarum JDM1] [Lactiplantibacillus mudanjiangensis]|uniref:Asp23/Gls24 family envelope stress response protein n=1 Tax=Lactiplantibacillus mudanjiangensis TaxID=1296538 RepID=UPI001015C336|nr:Asp23/Gls24 family envelope stress response protein [Lactiplantibacillus mudanjiangensis]VDG31247.1 alkaline shock protein [Lactobacillus plantarum JDM1] [Lactiplantibacillus mudanjiangensis]